jgi:ATP adenylyltransferase
LWGRIQKTSERAIALDVLQPIPTEGEICQDGGVRFVVRVVANLERKRRVEAEQETQEKRENPFLPYDEALLVAHLSESHLCLLNKYNVLDHHLLIVTRRFEHQEELLTRADFEALSRCMAEVDGLGFYNGGTVAGASQPHKHLQLAAGLREIPIARALGEPSRQGITVVRTLPFAHRLWTASASLSSAEAMLEGYRALLAELGLARRDRQSGPYNLLFTKRWMLLVPRSREHFESMSVNALGFAGALLCRDETELARVKEVGPMSILRYVGLPSAT